MSVSGGPTSIKQGKGGASSSNSKITATEYADYTDNDGKVTKGADVRKDLENLTSKSFDDIWNTPSAPNKDGKLEYVDKSIKEGEEVDQK